MKEYRWRLFIDESGEFKSFHDRSCVVGFLGRAPTAMAEARVRYSVERSFPEIPWPLHANLLNQEAAWLLWLERSTRTSELKNVAHEILKQAPLPAKPLLQEARASLEEGREPDYRKLKRIRAELHNTVGYLNFREKAKARRNALFKLIHHTLRQDPEHSHITCVATLGDPPNAPGIPDPYLLGLSALLERTANLLAHTGGSHSVAIYAARRDVDDPTLGKRTPLNRSHLERAVADASFPNEAVRFTLDDVLPYAEATTGLVMADLLANRVWKMRSASLTQVHRSIEGLGAEPGLVGLSGCAATGLARALILQGSRAGLDQVGSLRPPWAREQAIQWIAVTHEEGKQ